MQHQHSQVTSSITLLLRQTQHSTYFQKYSRWLDLLNRSDPESLPQLLPTFLDYFPFNYQKWLQYIQLTSPQKYAVALKRNPKSYQLWQRYLQYVKTTPLFQEQSKYRKELERAIVQIGSDTRSGSIYLEYFGLLSENYRYEFFKKIFTRALINLQEIYALFQSWFNSKTQAQLASIAAKQTKGRQSIPAAQLRVFLTKQINQSYKKTLQYRQKRLALQQKIKVFYFNGQQSQLLQDKPIWRQLITIDRTESTVENTSYCYERMLMAQMHDIELWEEVIHYLENETNKYAKVLNMFRYNKDFFLKFDTDLYFYWCDLEERENANEARKMYLELEKHSNKPEITLRHIQFQIRQKQWENAKTLFDTLITQTQQSAQQIQLLSYTLVQYSNYVTKYYKDYEYPKKLFQTYFEYLPYNNYLFSNYLSFMRNFEYKEGYYDQLMTLIMEGLKKARVLGEAEFSKVMAMVKHHLRTVLSSIYLIKLSERKMLEVQRA